MDGQRLIGFRNGIITFSFATRQYERMTDYGTLPVWLNDGRRALFCENEKLFLLDLQTRQVRDIFSVAPGRLESVAVSKDNRSLSLSVNTIEADIWLASWTETVNQIPKP